MMKNYGRNYNNALDSSCISNQAVVKSNKSPADPRGHFSPVRRLGVGLQAVASCQAEMKSDAFSLVDKSTVNRDFSVAEASFNLKLELRSQMHHCIEPRTIYHTARRQRINIRLFPRREILPRSAGAASGKRL